MASIMQGTTPSLTITFSPDDLQLSAVTAIELYVRNVPLREERVD